MVHYDIDASWASYLEPSAFADEVDAPPPFARASSPASSSSSYTSFTTSYSPNLHSVPSMFASTTDSPASSNESEPATPPSSSCLAPLLSLRCPVTESSLGAEASSTQFVRDPLLASTYAPKQRATPSSPLSLDTTSLPSASSVRREPSPTVNYVALDLEARQLASRVFAQTSYSGGKIVVASSRPPLTRAHYLAKKRKAVSFSPCPGSAVAAQVASAPMPALKSGSKGGRATLEMAQWLNALREAEVRAIHSRNTSTSASSRRSY